jgi:endonuclease YncB( thermonuclease family)
MPYPISYTPEGLALGDKPRFVSATDGDTPTIDVPVRMLGMDAPELHYAGASETKPGKFDAALQHVLSGPGSHLDPGLQEYLEPKLRSNPSTRHILQGVAAFAHFEQIVEERLKRISTSSGAELTPRRLFTKVSEQVFDRYGRMLAYVAPAYTRAERDTIPPKDRPTFNLQMVRDGHAISLLIYPNVPKPSDLDLVRSAIKKARQYNRGVWGGPHEPLHAYEYRWLVDVHRGQRDGPTRFCGDMTTAKLYVPQQYYKVPDENRLWFFEEDVGRAYEMGFTLAI